MIPQNHPLDSLKTHNIDAIAGARPLQCEGAAAGGTTGLTGGMVGLTGGATGLVGGTTTATWPFLNSSSRARAIAP